MALGDVDGDGDLDVVCANAFQNTLFLNQEGSLSEEAAWSSSREHDTWAVALGDVDGDGDLDVVFGNTTFTGGPQFRKRTTLYRNEGGTFTNDPVWSSRPSETRGVALGDVDGDGDLDLVCGNGADSEKARRRRVEAGAPDAADGDPSPSSSPQLDRISRPNTLYRNDGGVLTSEPVWFSSLANDTWAVALADVDGDEDLDLVCGNRGAGSTLYRNDTGTFTSDPVWVSPSDATLGVALGDVDGDGDLDLVCGNGMPVGRPDKLYRNDGGDSVFTATPVWTSTTPHTATSSVALGDVDCDGDLDLVCGNILGSNRLYFNEGGTLSGTPDWISGLELNTWGVALGDVNGDGHLDLVCGNAASFTTLYLYQVLGFPEAPTWSSSSIHDERSVALGDVDGDGDLDLVCGNESQSNTLYANQDSVLSDAPTWTSSASQNTKSVALGDVNGDGSLDLVCGNYFQSNSLHRNDAGVLTAGSVWSSSNRGRTMAVALGDVDGDGDLDLVCGNEFEGNTFYRNDRGDSVFLDMPEWTSAALNNTRAVALGDVNGDGSLDLACGNQRYNKLYLNEGGTFPGEPTQSFGYHRVTNALAFGDLDGDGDLDLACGNEGRNTLYLNQGGVMPSTPSWTFYPAYTTYGVALDDVNGDGYLDIIFGNLEGNTCYLNEGGMFSQLPVWTSPLANATRAVALGDVDGDGDLDLLCGNAAQSNTLYPGLKDPVYKGDLAAPNNQVPNSAAFLRRVRWEPVGVNLYEVRFSLLDVESDSVRVVPEFQFEGAPVWYPAEVPGGGAIVGPFASSPIGVDAQFTWDISRVPFDDRDVVLRLRAVSNPRRTGLIQYAASYLTPMGPIEPIRPENSPSVPSLVFPTVTVGDTVSVSFGIVNTGTADLTVSSLTLPSLEMGIDCFPPLILAPGDSEPVAVALLPREELSVVGALAIGSDDPVNPTISLPILADIRGLVVETTAQTETGTAPLGDALTIQVIPAAGVNVERGTLFHRPAGSGDSPLTRDLIFSGSALVSVIPGEDVVEGGIEYWVEVENSGVTATDPPGAPDDSVFFQTVESPASITLEVRPASGSDFFAGQSIAVVARLQQGSQFVSGALHYRQGGESSYRQTSLTLSGQLPEATIPGTEVGPRGMEYWVEVETETASLTEPAQDPGETPRTIRTTITDLQEDAVSPGSRYRIITVPLETSPEFQGTIETLLSDQGEFGSYDPVRWRLFRYDTGQGECAELSESQIAEFRPRPGRAFWLICAQAHRIDTAPVEGLSTPTDQPFEIVLQPGWTQVGNPFAFPVPCGTIVRSSELVGEPIAFDPTAGAGGDYLEEPPPSLDPLQGYFFRNSSAAPETLWIPPVEAVLGASPVPPAPQQDRIQPTRDGGSAAEAWRIRLVAASTSAGSATIVLGTDPAAAVDHDALDREKPPSPPGCWINLGIPHRDWGLRSGLYRRDLRDPYADGHTWNIEILTVEAGEEVGLEGCWEITPTADVSLRLIDLEQSASVVPRDPAFGLDEYSLLSFGKKRPYRLAVLVGSEEYVSREGDRLVQMPVALTLDRNAPNPFRHATRIRFGIPQPTRTVLTIYDLRGRRVASLVDGRVLPAGYHVEVWDGRDSRGRRVSAGVYFYRLEANKASRSGKMVVIR
jgi:hypothetical protein